MREVGTLGSSKKALLFADYLLSRGIESEIDQTAAGESQVWILDDTRFEEAGKLFDVFKENQEDPMYEAAAKGAAEIRARREKEERAAAKLAKSREDIFGRSGLMGTGIVTLALIVLSIIITLVCNFGENINVVQTLAFIDVLILHGQIWRIITPIFMHFSFIHVLFNVMWLFDLGGAVEKIRKARFLLLFVLVSGAVSNYAQFLVGGPLFGGMSGVVYGLLGFVWMQSKFNPWSPFVLHKVTVQMMLIWLVLGFTGLVGHMANFAHLGGLVVGVIWGYIDAKRAVGR